jgi:hypothetical protein
MPKSSCEHFDEIFKNLDANKEQVGISNYILRVTTLEEVFIKIGEEAEVQEAHSAESQTLVN